jgi:hypothetical protein
MNFSYSAVWNDTVALLKSHGSLLLAVAGVFILLPLLMTAYFLPTPTSSTDPIGVLGRYYRENWHWLALASLINSIGSIAIYKLIFSGRGLSVGQAIGGALALLPFFFIATMIVSIAIGVGFAFLVIPGLYLLGRLAITAPTMVAENLRNPFSAMGESWRLTKGRGWAVAGLIAIIAIAGTILAFVITAIFGSVFVLALGREGIGGLLVLILSAAANAVFYTVLIVLLAAIYRALRDSGAKAGPTH